MKVAQAFSRLGHDVTLHAIASRHGVGFTFEELCESYDVTPTFELRLHTFMQVRAIGRGCVYPRLVAQAVQSAARDPDLIYGRHVPSLLRLTRVRRPIIFEAHSPPGNTIRKTVESRLLFGNDTIALVVISDALKRIYQEIFPKFNKPIIVAHDGADDPFEKRYQPFEDWKGRAGSPQVGYVGHLYAGRGIEVIVKLSETMPNVDFHVFGGTEDLLKKWRAVAQVENLFFHGFLPNSQVQRAFLHLDVMLAPYQDKVAVVGNRGNTAAFMSPLKIFEYMSWGKPMVVSDLPAIREILTDQHNALLVRPGDCLAWRAGLEKILGDAELLRRLGRNARESFEMQRSWLARTKHILSTLGFPS
jgi:glycosyltransferase involved in cell wall biosynthesis